MKIINKVKLHNFKRFQNLEVSLNESLNILVGENESGKSSILTAINLVLSGSRSQVEKIGLERLLNSQATEVFLASEKKYEDLPVMYVELWLNEQNNFELRGKNNSEDVECDGLRMECKPIEALSGVIKVILESDDVNFPYEYYQVTFSTFQGDQYTGYKKYLKHIVIDTALIGNDYAIREYITGMYESYVEGPEKHKHQNEYRKAKNDFRDKALAELNGRVEGYSFSVKNDVKTNLRTDLTIVEDNIDIDNKGKGRQCFIKTEFALRRAENPASKIDVALIEEPENHLSHINMKKLIEMIGNSEDKQLIIATHSNMISARLDLRKTILLHSNAKNPLLLNGLPEDTARFFMKAPNHGVLDFVLSKKVILVEGDAEYMLMEGFFQAITGRSMESADVQCLSVGGTSFKRYLDIARILAVKVAVIRDNDKNHDANTVQPYAGYQGGNIRIFSDVDNDRFTFEVCVYTDNKNICDQLFAGGRRILSVLDYMLNNKTEAAFSLLEHGVNNLATPQYIRDAIEWINA
jgi:predicted ATPase